MDLDQILLHGNGGGFRGKLQELIIEGVEINNPPTVAIEDIKSGKSNDLGATGNIEDCRGIFLCNLLKYLQRRFIVVGRGKLSYFYSDPPGPNDFFSRSACTFISGDTKNKAFAGFSRRRGNRFGMGCLEIRQT